MKRNHEKIWDEIDKIADENDGHYVVPTKPGKEDTSDVSEFIRETKEKRARDKTVKDFLSEEEKQRFEEANTLMRVAKDIKTFEKYKLEVIELLEAAAERAIYFYSGSKEELISTDESFDK